MEEREADEVLEEGHERELDLLFWDAVLERRTLILLVFHGDLRAAESIVRWKGDSDMLE